MRMFLTKFWPCRLGAYSVLTTPAAVFKLGTISIRSAHKIFITLGQFHTKLLDLLRENIRKWNYFWHKIPRYYGLINDVVNCWVDKYPCTTDLSARIFRHKVSISTLSLFFAVLLLSDNTQPHIWSIPDISWVTLIKGDIHVECCGISLQIEDIELSRLSEYQNYINLCLIIVLEYELMILHYILECLLQNVYQVFQDLRC